MKRFIFILVSITFFLIACSNDDNSSKASGSGESSLNTTLEIAYVGQTPEVNDENINLTSLQLDDVNEERENLESEYNVIFFMPDIFSEASQNKYTTMFKELTIPAVFIETEKSEIPFVTEDMSYDEVPEVAETDHFAIIYTYNGEGNDFKEDVWYIDNSEDVNDNYRNLFKKIEEL